MGQTHTSPLSVLNQLQNISVVVADTGELDAIAEFRPLDATTNPSLLLKVAQTPKYAPLLQEAITHYQQLNKKQLNRKQQNSVNSDITAFQGDEVDAICDHFAVLVGCKILALISGRVSTEVPAQLSFDTQATVAKARSLIELYEAAGISSERVLIKIAGTWEGIRAAEILEKSGIQCNVTLIFSTAQAIASAEAGAYLISPFVGRILDWHKTHRDFTDPNPINDPGVISVRTIYNHFKTHGFKTIVMGASFRNTGEILALAGCDRLTISPALLSALAADHETQIERQLIPLNETDQRALSRKPLSENDFRWQMNDDEMAHFKLAEGIRNFHNDYVALRTAIQSTAIQNG